MTASKLEKTIPFDQYSRQFQVSAILDKLRAPDEQFTILDVGGYRGHTADFLTKDTVTVMDLYDVKDKNYVKGSALAMPFDDNSFDYVVSFDVLEHIPDKSRRDFVSECARVSRNGVIICAPSKNPANQLAERNLNELYKKLHAKPHEWLKEHIEYGIPDFDEIALFAQSHNYATIRFHSNKTELWVAIQEAIFLNSKYPLAATQLLQLNEFYNTHFKYDGGGSADSAYRSILCCLKDSRAITALSHDGPLNEAIDPVVEIKLRDKIANFNLSLVSKTTQLADNYKELHEHEKKRAEDLHKHSEELWQTVNKLNAELSSRKLLRIAGSLKKKLQSNRSKSS